MTDILIVDDKPEIITILRKMLEKEGFKTIQALSGGEGMEKIRASRPALILLDALMPDLNGWELCRRIKSDAALRDIPVVIVTIKNAAEDIRKSFEAGAQAHLGKPIDREIMINTIKRILAGDRSFSPARPCAYS